MGQIKLRRAFNEESAEQSTTVLASGEPGVVVETGELRIGNGTDRWSDLPALADTFTSREMFDAWSLPLVPGGVGGGGIMIDEGAGVNIARDTSASGSRAYIAMGRDALGSTKYAAGCTAIGQNTMSQGTPGPFNEAIGMYALTHLNGGHRNVALGSLAGHFLTTGYQDIFIGRDAGHPITTGYCDVAIGYRALATGYAPRGFSGEIENQYTKAAGVYESIAIGANAGTSLVSSGNTVIGFDALKNAGDHGNSVYIGWRAGASIGSTLSENNKVLKRPALTGTYDQTGTKVLITCDTTDIAVGNMIGIRFTSGAINTVTGGEMQWLPVATRSTVAFTFQSPVSQDASGNVVIDIIETTGTGSLPGSNVVIGFAAQQNANTTGGNNVIVGESAALTGTGSQNTVVGGRAGYNLSTGSQVTGLGYNSARATWAGEQLKAGTNVTSLGHDSRVPGNNSVMIGNSTQKVYTPDGTISGPSDERDKADIRDTSLGLEFITKIKPREFRWDQRAFYVKINDNGETEQLPRDGSKKRTRFHQGVIAQELIEVTDQLGIDFAGLQHHEEDQTEDIYTVTYSEFIPPLIKAVQELATKIEALETT